MRRLRIYISGPITAGDRNWNYYQAAKIEKEMILAGFAPMNPMATMTLPFAWDGEVDHATWLERDFAWIDVADAVYRLPGESKGGDMETDYADRIGVPVIFDWQTLIVWRECFLRNEAEAKIA